MVGIADRGSINDVGVKTTSGTNGLATAADVRDDRAPTLVHCHDEAEAPEEGRQAINSQQRGSVLVRGLETSDGGDVAMVETRFQHQRGGRSVLSNILADKKEEYKQANGDPFGATLLKMSKRKDAS